MPSVSLCPGDLTSAQLYDLLVEAVQPRPIALVSTISKEGIPNLAPFSFFMLGGSNPPSLAYSPTVSPDGREKNSVTNVEETGEFVVNLVTREMEEGMNASAFGYPAGFDEWTIAGFEATDSVLVKPKRVEVSPVQFECELFQIVKHGTQWGAARYVIGEIVRIHVNQASWDNAAMRLASQRLIARLGGREYIDLQNREIFELARPAAPVAQQDA
jgi:flavin reductase (DIM6/NTAB) family NADH-FMN oxidoreductase RutF